MRSTEGKAAAPALARRVREQIYDHVFIDLGGEVGGVLVGDYVTPAAASVSAAIPALQADGQRASLTFTHEAWAEIHAVLERRYPGKRIVGWYHSHPGFGIFLSRHDLFIHENFFSDPRQVAFVVDPYNAREGWFGWRDGQIVAVGEETATPRPASRPAPVSGADARPARGRVWLARAGYALAGIVIAVVVWLAALRNDFRSTRPATRAHTTHTQSPGRVAHHAVTSRSKSNTKAKTSAP